MTTARAYAPARPSTAAKTLAAESRWFGFFARALELNPRKCLQRGAGRSRCTYLRDGLFEGTEGGAIVLHNLWVMKARVRGRQHPAWSRSRVDARTRSAEKTWQRQARAALPENGVAVDGAGDRLARAPETRDVEGERTFLRAVNAILNASKVRANKRVSVA